MLFKEVIHAIRPHLMKDAEVPSFMRNLIQMLCDIPEDEWYTKRDPSSVKCTLFTGHPVRRVHFALYD